MDTNKPKDRRINRQRPRLNPLQKLFVGVAIGQANRSKKKPPSLAKLDFTSKKEK
jgi:hypothetical protein